MIHIRRVDSCLAFAVCLFLAGHTGVWAQEDGPSTSRETRACIACHESFAPGQVGDWRGSRHARTSVEMALQKPALERRLSVSESAGAISPETAVGCYECHGSRPAEHEDTFSHYGYDVYTVVSPRDCAGCHSEEVTQYTGSKKANARLILTENDLFMTLVDTITSTKQIAHTAEGLSVTDRPASEEVLGEACFACHGTDVSSGGIQTLRSAFGNVQVPRLANWPNQGVGRMNPDGSLGSCTACHPRHSFSIEIARKPETCGQCHLEPDVPAYNVYKESKHGNIASSLASSIDWQAVPWVPGEDFPAPTCATCHISLIADTRGRVISSRSHDFSSRLWLRIFGLPTSHPEPVSGETWRIRNADGQRLPVTFSGETATGFLIGEDEQQTRRAQMQAVCTSCHSTQWTLNQFHKLDEVSGRADELVLAATSIVSRAWERDRADATNPFDESIEMRWVAQWLLYANSVRYAAAMMGPDYAAFKNGWWSLTRNLQEMIEESE